MRNVLVVQGVFVVAGAEEVAEMEMEVVERIGVDVGYRGEEEGERVELV